MAKRREKYLVPDWLTPKVQSNLEDLLRKHTVEAKDRAAGLLRLAKPNLQETTIQQLLSKLRSNMEFDTLIEKEAKAKQEEQEAIRQQKLEAQAERDRTRQETRKARLELGFTEDEIAKMEAEDPVDEDAKLESLFKLEGDPS